MTTCIRSEVRDAMGSSAFERVHDGCYSFAACENTRARRLFCVCVCRPPNQNSNDSHFQNNHLIERKMVTKTTKTTTAPKAAVAVAVAAVLSPQNMSFFADPDFLLCVRRRGTLLNEFMWYGEVRGNILFKHFWQLLACSFAYIHIRIRMIRREKKNCLPSPTHTQSTAQNMSIEYGTIEPYSVFLLNTIQHEIIAYRSQNSFTRRWWVPGQRSYIFTFAMRVSCDLVCICVAHIKLNIL